jgi:alcohol dehydrogenase (cytochrome c)
VTPAAGGLVFFGDVGGNFYAVDAANGQKLWGEQIGGAIEGGVITYTANGAESRSGDGPWPVKVETTKIAILGVD